jgi:hypothetical protein
VGILILIFSFNYFFVLIFGDDIYHFYNDYYQRHLARRPHIVGQIKCNINGIEYLLNNSQAELVYIDNFGKKYDIRLDNGTFSRKDGEYGDNLFVLNLSSDFCVKNINKTLVNGISIEFGYRTANNWHKENVSLNIEINKEENMEVANVKLVQIINGDDNGSEIKSFILQFENHVGEQEKLKILNSFI